jgi:4-carboxymuconolactone decarboxylase
MKDEIFERGVSAFAAISPDGATAPWEALADLAPTMGLQVNHAFGTVMSRPNLDLRTREIATVCMLAVLGGCEGQVAYHVGGALRAGASAPEVIEALTQVSVYAGVPRALNAIAAARPVFAEFGLDPLADAPPVVVTSFLAALDAGDFAAAGRRLAPDAVCVLPGDPERVPWAGTWTGRAGLTRLRVVLGDAVDIETVDWREPMAGGAGVAVPATITYRPSGAAESRTSAFIVEATVVNGAITSVTVYAREWTVESDPATSIDAAAPVAVPA